jgi:hypothetical protein
MKDQEPRNIEESLWNIAIWSATVAIATLSTAQTIIPRLSEIAVLGRVLLCVHWGGQGV